MSIVSDERVAELLVQNERMRAALEIVASALRVLGEDGWSDASYLMRVCRSALEGKP